ncbi:bifunctional adenosylcobinamide kinase/adenosylcobinamide-phosphate guanylyltransferase [Brevibacillus borstelensis]|uniref:bifunctional adenosylcobinamide kinase/adenosylcobinamide-phosphate guanylyltransferase n=1 Tax=Brevibacillus borstelensis TaxID=45462 RepID=UPI00203B985C|nr:bifunctional adenosylcobinamide kinase/adenosylcobinamide-phosphate guanylyltransferase [Brevibacillus borstelensis]
MSLILVTGGVRSGKSRFAEELARDAAQDVLYVATGKAWDDEMARRIELHRERRPDTWGLCELGGRLSESLDASKGYSVVLLDCLSTWVSGRLMDIPEQAWRDESITKEIVGEAKAWLDAVAQTNQTVIAVTSEVGLGGGAMSRLGRWFADILGDVNQQAARQADTVYAVIAGLPWRMKG